MSEISIRSASEKDIKNISKLLLQVCNVHNEIRPDLFIKDGTKYGEDELRAILLNEKTPVFAAVNENDELIGYAFCQLIESSFGASKRIQTLYIDDLCVDKELRGRHIGSALFDAVKKYAKKLGCHNVTLNVWEGNDAARRFYSDRGMKVQKTGMELIL